MDLSRLCAFELHASYSQKTLENFFSLFIAVLSVFRSVLLPLGRSNIHCFRVLRIPLW